MAEAFADAFKRYWALIVSVAVIAGSAGIIFVGGITGLRDELTARLATEREERIAGDSKAASDLRDSMTERAGLLRDINGHFSRIDERLDRLEQQ